MVWIPAQAMLLIFVNYVWPGSTHGKGKPQNFIIQSSFSVISCGDNLSGSNSIYFNYSINLTQ